MDEGNNLYDDLYEDVGDVSFFQPFQETDSREEEFKKKELELNGKVESLQKEVEALQQDKAVLTRNISCLFKTAQMELARKDKQMKELRDENLRFKLRGPANVRPHLTKAAVPEDKTNGQTNHRVSNTVGTPDARSFDEDKRLRDRGMHPNSKEKAGFSYDRVVQGSSSIPFSNRRQTSTLEATIVDTALAQAEMSTSEQSNRSRPDSLERRIREPDSDERKTQRTSPRGNQRRDTNFAVEDGYNKPRNGSSSDKDSRGDRQRDGRRNADGGHSRYGSPDRNCDNSRGTSRDRRRVDDNRKRHRSRSRERDGRPEDRESSRASKTLNTSGSEYSRERQRDISNRHQR